MSESNIKLVSVRCPDCGAALSIEEGRSQAFCTYCGAKVIVSNKNEHVYRTIDEAEIRKVEVEKEIRLKEIELKNKEMDLDEKNSKHAPLPLFVLLFSLILAILLYELISRLL